MDWKKLAWCAVLSGASMGLVACGDDDGGEPPGEPQTVAYVVATANIPQPEGETLVGFDLDGMVSTGETDACTDRIDWTSPSNGPGVDNQFSGVASLLEGMVEGGIPGAVEEQIADGSFLLIMEVSDVNSFNNDSSVQVHLFLGTPESGTVTVGGTGRIEAGQSFTVEQDIGTVAASISGGRLIVDDVDLPLRLEVSGEMIELVLHGASVGAQITPTGLAGGEIGAYLLVSDIIALADQFGLPDAGSLIDSFAPPDIDEDGDMTCEAVSLGLTFDAVAAQTANTTSM